MSDVLHSLGVGRASNIEVRTIATSLARSSRGVRASWESVVFVLAVVAVVNWWFFGGAVSSHVAR